jgi:Lon protease-like protein
MSDDVSPLSDFSGTARLFPLPNLVLFPHVMQPLHVFEPRYRQMTAEALAGDRLIALALLEPGWEAEYDGKPGIHPVACLGRVVAEQRLDDGRYNILLRGLSRIRVLEELPQGKLYRTARVELLADRCHPEGQLGRELRKRLARAVARWFPEKGAVYEQFRKLFRSDLGLGPLSDIISFALPIELDVKQALLEQLDVSRRTGWLLDYLQTHLPKPAKSAKSAKAAKSAEPPRKFPPEFSAN